MKTPGPVKPPSSSAADLRDADRIHSAAIHILRRLRAADRETGISPARLSALSVIVFAGPLRLLALAEAEQVRPPTATRLVDALEAEGLVTRRRDRADGRQVVIAATAKGRRLLHEGKRRRVERLAAAIAALPAADRRRLRAAVATLTDLADGLRGGPAPR